MVLYGLTLAPLTETLRTAVPAVSQCWYADDAAMAGAPHQVADAMTLLAHHGPQRGYYPEPAKSVVICPPDLPAPSRQPLEQFPFQFADGHRHLGGFIGNTEARTQWLTPRIAAWATAVELLAKAATKFPQSAYAGLTKSLQAEWQYMQRVVPDCGPAFQPVEDVLRTRFLPTLLQEPPDLLPDHLRQRLALPVSHAGLGIPNPCQTADDNHAASLSCTKDLTQSLVTGSTLDVADYLTSSRAGSSAVSKTRDFAAELQFTALMADQTPATKRQSTRAKSTGAWLTVMPDPLNGTDLSAEEFHDSVRLRYGLQPTALPNHCDGCSHKFSVEHALSCKVGGLVMLRHREVAREWQHLCTQALSSAAVTAEPHIFSGRGLAAGTQGLGTTTPPDSRGDVAAHGFWHRGMTTVFDIRITDTDAPSYRNQDPGKILASHEKEKKAKYLAPCLARRRHFTPLVFSVDGLRGAEATAASKKLAALLAAKWDRAYSEVCGYVRSRLAIALVRTTTMCLRGTRDPTARATHPMWDNSAGLGLYQA
jgi:hypothetical protein